MFGLFDHSGLRPLKLVSDADEFVVLPDLDLELDEEKKTLTFNIVASTFPNQEGASQTRSIDKLTTDEFVNTNRGAARDGPAAAANYYTKAK